VPANKLTGQNTKPKDDVLTSFYRVIQHASKAIRKSKKMMWVPKCSAPIKVELITRASTARSTLKSEPHVVSKILLSKHMNKKVGPWGHDRMSSSRRQPRGKKTASGHQDHWRPHYQFLSVNAPMYGKGDSHPGMFTCLPWSWYSLWMHYDESLGLCQSHIHVICLHGYINIDYCIEAENK
jgi:hypothetical protein